MLLTGLLLAVASSLALNAGYLLQHLGGATAPSVDGRHPLATVRGLMRSRTWVVGTGTGLTGSVLHIAALALAPLTLVQAFSAGGLAVVVPSAARVVRVPLRRDEHICVGAIVAALVALSVRPATASRAPQLGAVAVGFVLVALVAAAALARTGGAARLALATGLLYGLSDAATKGFTRAAGHGLLAAVLTPWPPLIVALCAAAFFTFQRALQIGPAATVIVLMTAVMNVTAVVAGIAVFGESVGHGTTIGGLHLAAMAVVAMASWRLAATQVRIGASAPRAAGQRRPPSRWDRWRPRTPAARHVPAPHEAATRA